MQQPVSSAPSARKLSVGTKLLLVIGILLFLVIAFLNLSAILLVSDDKRAYIYESQATQTSLVGNDFVNNGSRAVDFLRLALATSDRSTLRALIENQNELSALQMGSWSESTQAFVPGELITKRTMESEFPKTLATLPADAWKRLAGGIKKRGVEFFNFARVSQAPYLGVVITDTSRKGGDLPLAIGFVSLKRFSESVSTPGLTVVSGTGEILFDSDPGRLVSGANASSDPLIVAARESAAAQGAYEFKEDERRYLGSFVKPGYDMVVAMRTDWSKVQATVFTMVEKFVLLGFAAIGSGIIMAIIFAKTLTQPIVRLFAATKEVAQGNFNVQVEVKSRDEIGALTESFNTMSRQITELVDSKVEMVKIQNELDIASTVQQTLIPPDEFENSTLQVRSHYESASQCGGDWWGIFNEGGRTVLMIADATGHGFPSALITASARSCFSFMHKLASEDPDFTFSPGAMLAYANRVIFEASLGNIMMTFFIGVYDPKAKTLVYSSAGHNPPWLFKNTQGTYKLKSLTAVGNRLGEARDVPDFDEHTVDVDPGDVLFMYTDGIIEGKDLKDEMYGKKRVRKILEANLAGDLKNILNELMVDFRKHNTGKAFDDDVTLVMTRFKEGGASPTA